MSTPRRKKKTAPKQNKQTVNPAQPDALPHCPNSEGAEFRRREIHRVLAEEFDHANKDYRPGWSAKRLAQLVGYSELTVKRTIEYMRKTLMLQIGYDKKRDSYYYKERVAAFPTTQVSEGELICLCGMMQAMAPFKNTPFVKKLRPLIDKFIEGMPPELRVSFRTLEQRISFRSTGLDAHLDPAVFEIVIAALLKNQELAIDYVKMHYEEQDEEAAEVGRSRRERREVEEAGHESGTAMEGQCGARVPTRHLTSNQQAVARAETRPTSAHIPSEPPKPERRTIEPVHLACVDNGWYLFAYDRAGKRSGAFSSRGPRPCE